MVTVLTYQSEIKEKLGSQIWRLNNLYFIRSKKGIKIKMKFNYAQSKFFNELHYFNIILKARQLGFSTFYVIYMLDCAIFNSNHRTGIIDFGIKDARKKLRMAKFAYDNLPKWLRELKTMTIRAAEEIEFSNGSGMTVGTSHRGDTLQKLLVSEYGKISAYTPDKAAEIKKGAFNTVDNGQQICIESTAEGKSGEYHGMCQEAINIERSGGKLAMMQFKFHFFPWFDNPDYRLTDDEVKKIIVPEDTLNYLEEFNLDNNQKAWYALKSTIMGDDMLQEFPSTPDEAFAGSMKGAFYRDEMKFVRSNDQITNLPYNRKEQVHTFWDLGGASDYMSILFYQKIDNKDIFIDYHESNNNGWDFYAKLLMDKGYNYGTHFMPHDTNNRIVGKVLETSQQIAESVGIRPVKIVKRTKNKYKDIQDHCKPALFNCYFNTSSTGKIVTHLDNYRKRWDKINSTWLKEPHHDDASHGADAYRTFVMANVLGLTKKKGRKPIDLSPRGSGGMFG